MRKEILALIPARGGSKGIPRKNLIQLAGQPLIAYSITQAKQSAHITRVIVSTDDQEIAGVAKKLGAEVPFLRPAEFAQDLSPDIDVFIHALTWLRGHEKYTPELVVHLRPTGPLRKVTLIDQAIEQMLAHPEADALRSVSTPIQSPYKMWRIEGGTMKPLLLAPGIEDSHSQPRQKLPEVFWQNGYVDIVRSRTILEKKQICGSVVLPFIIDEPIYELDYPDDIPELEKVLKERLSGKETISPEAGVKKLPV